MMRWPQLPPDDDDWIVPAPDAFPYTSDRSAVPPALSIGPLPDVPPGSAYSARRNMWRAPSGATFSAGDFRPLPPDQNTIDSQGYMMDRLYGPTTRLRDI